MEIRNLGKNILFRICQELARRGRCRSVEIEFITTAFSDLPSETVDESLRWLVRQGWLRKDDMSARVILTEEGRSAIGTMVPASLRKDCYKPAGCHH